ncbi:hypothetical protein OIDMADRAFT_35758 [Oidiodendron maius Zn]|uniref:Transcription activator GCR1-like domain-containing protein n=1 Tax=Oidiodendron maius (strain Zn) TaxID=913774 RepID=A0A0C3GPX7_OIDMZ|nr:hypothetical protein OIDMADRAFT_35758 [Oidiodendron maius Zn]
MSANPLSLPYMLITLWASRSCSALPELSSVLESTREAVLHNSTRLARQLEGNLDTLLQGRVPVTSTDDSSADCVSVGALTASPPAPGQPVYTALAKGYTVNEVCREWKEGLAGQPAVRGLEEAWGSSWRPGNTARVQFCRQTIIWDKVQVRMARGRAEDEAVAELELLRAGRSLKPAFRRAQEPPRARLDRALAPVWEAGRAAKAGGYCLVYSMIICPTGCG